MKIKIPFIICYRLAKKCVNKLLDLVRDKKKTALL